MYCISSWGGVPPSRQKRLILLQKRAIRIISKADYRDHTSNLFYNLNLLKQPEIYELRLATIMYKINNGTWSSNLKLQKLDLIHSYKTRLATKQNYSLPQVKTNIGRNSFVYRGPKIWSEISTDVKKLPLTQFKKPLSKSMIMKYLE